MALPRVPVRTRWVLASLLAGALALMSWPRELPAGERAAHSALQALRYPAALGAAHTQTDALVDRLIVGAAGERPSGPLGALRMALHMTRQGSVIFEVRGFASVQERRALLERAPYRCKPPEGAVRVRRVGAVDVWQLRRSWLTAWLPEPIYLCGYETRGLLVAHVSGFLSEHTWDQLAEPLVTMIGQRQVDWQAAAQRFSSDPQGCRMRADREPPLYVQFRSERDAQAGVVRAGTLAWIDLPFGSHRHVKRFRPAQLEEVTRACRDAALAHRRAREAGRAGNARAVLRSCSPLMITLEQLYPERPVEDLLDDERALPLIESGGFRYTLPEQYVPARCPAPDTALAAQ